MKKCICLFLSFLLVLSVLSGCVGSPVETTLPAETTLPVGTTLPAETAMPTEATVSLEELRANLPVMDGSTSMIPLEAGIRAALFGKTMEEATADVAHTTTWASFYNLLSGRADLIFSVPLSADQKAAAEEEGVTLESVPIAMEGFVFVVNAENPVDSLTQQQIKDIYSGKITNWSEVGGLDEEIIPYQRNNDSGSQNYMIEFMGDAPLMDAPTELRPASMSGLMDVIAINDNSRAAIGYSVYTYAADMYGNGNEVKFIQVDGVAPNKAAFADGSYPLMGYNYVIFNANEPKDSYVRQFVNWMLTAEGQTAIAKAGYVTVVDVGYDYEEAILEKYEGIGTGPAAGETPSSEYAVAQVHHDEYGIQIEWEPLAPTVAELSDGTKTYRVTQLTDQALTDEINAWIDEQMVWAAEERPALEALLDTLNQGEAYEVYSYGLLWSDYQPEGMDAACIVTAKNGYLSVAVSLCYTYNVMDTQRKSYRTETATWDLLTGEKLTAEELFCQGVDVDQVLNDHILRFSGSMEDEFSGYVQLKQDFSALTPKGWHITIDSIYFDYDTPWFVHGEQVALDDLPDGTLVTEAPRDFSDCIIQDGDLSVVRQFRISDRDLRYEHVTGSEIYCTLLEESAHPNAAAINEEVLDFVNTYYSDEAIQSYFSSLGYEDIYWYPIDWYLQNLGGKYLHFFSSAPEYYLEEESRFIQYPYEESLLYDLETGERISLRDILKEGWEEAVTWSSSQAPMAETDAPITAFRLENGAFLSIWFTEDGTDYIAWIPTDYLIY